MFQEAGSVTFQDKRSGNNLMLLRWVGDSSVLVSNKDGKIVLLPVDRLIVISPRPEEYKETAKAKKTAKDIKKFIRD